MKMSSKFTLRSHDAVMCPASAIRFAMSPSSPTSSPKIVSNSTRVTLPGRVDGGAGDCGGMSVMSARSGWEDEFVGE